MKKYLIKKGDTLESISKKLDITVFELRDFHNTHCELHNLIGSEISSHLKEILYLPASEITRQNLTELKQDKSFSLVLNPSLQKTTYHTAVTSYQGSKQNTLSCTTQIQWLKRNQVKITKEDFLINHKKPDLMADRLAEKINTVLYPLELSLDDTGKISSLSNYQEIKSRWKTVKKEYSQYFTGEELEKYIQLNETIINSEEELLKKLKKDWFLCAFFNGIYKQYTLNENSFSEKYFPVIPSIPPVHYTVQPEIENKEDEKQLKLSFKGKASDKRNLFDFENENYYPSSLEQENSNPVEGNYSSWYILDYNHYQINSLYIECTLLVNKEQKVEVRAFKLPEPETIHKEEGILEIGKSKSNPNPHKKSLLFD